MTVKIVKKRDGFDPSCIKGEWLRAQVRELLNMTGDSQRQQLSRLINIERQFGAKDLDALHELREQLNGKEAEDHRVPDRRPGTYDVE